MKGLKNLKINLLILFIVIIHPIRIVYTPLMSSEGS